MILNETEKKREFLLILAYLVKKLGMTTVDTSSFTEVVTFRNGRMKLCLSLKVGLGKGA